VKLEAEFWRRRAARTRSTSHKCRWEREKTDHRQDTRRTTGSQAEC